ncbi:hypothetical protein P3T76_005808 [Phytophthora citrophthora]|uniref:DUF7726 domain-containing protein n=1 Tax=Phytophthora citrophthora TaxID=4793 RepID=A0AAD9GS43_9STRA|nr:hypothetical protein P3T76_005808 [Phytophthora citrophthora]
MYDLLSKTASYVAEASATSESPLVFGGVFASLTGQPQITNVVDAAPLVAARPRVLEIPATEEESEEEFDEDYPEWAKWNCDQIRTKIRNFLGTKEMAQTAFLKLCDINSNSYYRFMNLKGPYSGSENQTYEGAAIFFYRREKTEKEEKAKLKAMAPKDRKRKATEEKEQKTKKRKAGDDLLEKILAVEITDTDKDGDIPVYDDCDEIRKKINFFLGEKTVTKAAFLRALGHVNSNSLRSFMNLKRGAASGAANVVYRTGYVFFEKKRILEGGKKTKKRLENELEQGGHGFPLRHDNGMRWVTVAR